MQKETENSRRDNFSSGESSGAASGAPSAAEHQESPTEQALRTAHDVARGDQPRVRSRVRRRPSGQPLDTAAPHQKQDGPEPWVESNLTHGQAFVHSAPMEHPAGDTPGDPVLWPGDQARSKGARKATSNSNKHSGSLKSLVTTMVIVGLISGGVSAATTAYVMSQGNSSPANQQPSAHSVVIGNSERVGSVSAVAAKVIPSVVTVDVVASNSGSNSRGSAGSGSGVIISEDGYVVTNAHVVTLDGNINNPQVTVVDSEGRRHRTKVVSIDAAVDLAVLQIQDASNLTPIAFADSSKLNVGDEVLAIGSPLGLDVTVTRGIISNLDRAIRVATPAAPQGSDDSSSESSPGEELFRFFLQPKQAQPRSSIAIPVIQTDAAINHGNSGGPLVDMEGKLVGINVAIASSGGGGVLGAESSGNIGVGFSLPSDLVRRVATEIISTGKVSHGFLGVNGAPGYGGKNPTYSGVTIRSMEADSPAQAAGLKVGDLIVGINDKRIDKPVDLAADIRSYPAGSVIKIEYMRDGNRATAEVTLSELATS